MSSPLRVLITDDSPVVRLGLRTLLSQDPALEVVGEAGDGDECIAQVAELHPDVVLLDVRMPRRDGLATVGEIAGQTKVVMMTFTDEASVIRRAMEAGAAGYLVHGTFDADALSAMVRSVAGGLTALSGPAQLAMSTPAPAAADERAAGAEHPDYGLSARQREVMELIALGRSNREIADTLFLAEKTVKNHINQIFATLGVRNRSEAMALWLGVGAVDR